MRYKIQQLLHCTVFSRDRFLAKRPQVKNRLILVAEFLKVLKAQQYRSLELNEEEKKDWKICDFSLRAWKSPPENIHPITDVAGQRKKSILKFLERLGESIESVFLTLAEKYDGKPLKVARGSQLGHVSIPNFLEFNQSYFCIFYPSVLYFLWFGNPMPFLNRRTPLFAQTDFS